jgi:hypothetical protein
MIRKTLHRLPLFAPILLLVAGCSSGRYPVAGHVLYQDGTPVDAGTVIAEATIDGKAVAVQGNIGTDGYFSWGATRPGDGALPGHYKVIVVPRALGDSELSQGKRPAVPGKYTRYETSGLSYEVKPESNTFNITVSRPKSNAKEN